MELYFKRQKHKNEADLLKDRQQNTEYMYFYRIKVGIEAPDIKALE
ncbi:hypothetical protein L1766_09125 [Thermovorax subterraneus]|nr:hypothetical protein [Thermovorax subterraneus]